MLHSARKGGLRPWRDIAKDAAIIAAVVMFLVGAFIASTAHAAIDVKPLINYSGINQPIKAGDSLIDGSSKFFGLVTTALTPGDCIEATNSTNGLGDAGGACGGGSGTVTSVSLSMPSIFTVSGSPCTVICSISVTLPGGTTGSGAVVLATSPTLTTPNLGTPSAINLANATNLPCAALPSFSGDATNSGCVLTVTETGGVVFGYYATGTDASHLTGTAPNSVIPVPGPAALGGVESLTCPSHQWVMQLDTSGVLHCSQPAFTDISGSLGCAQLPALTGDVVTSSCAATIQANTVTNAKAAQMAANTIKGNFTGSTANAQDMAMVSCSAATKFSIWTTNMGFGCKTLGLSDLPSIGAGDAVGNCTGSSAAPQDCALSALIDQAFGSIEGEILYRDASVWKALPAGVAAQVLTSGGPSAPVVWGNSIGGTGTGLFSYALSALPTTTSTGLSHLGTSVTATNFGGGIYLTSSTPNPSYAYTTTVPATPYSITVLLAMSGGAPAVGWTDGTKIQLIFLNNSVTDSRVYVQSYSNSSTFAATNYSASSALYQPIWLKIRDDGTTVYFMFGSDGVNWITAYSVAKSSGYLGSSGYSHIFAGTVNNGEDMTIFSWTQGN